MKIIDKIIKYTLYIVVIISLTICIAHISIYLGMGKYALDTNEKVLTECVFDTVNHDEVGARNIHGTKEILRRNGKCDTAINMKLTDEQIQQVKEKFIAEYNEKFNDSTWSKLFDMTELDVYQNNQNIVVKCNFKEKYTVNEHSDKDYLTFTVLSVEG